MLTITQSSTVESPTRRYKPQKISPKFEGSVRSLLHKKIRDSMIHPQFNTDVMKPMKMDPLMDQEVRNLSRALHDVTSVTPVTGGQEPRTTPVTTVTVVTPVTPSCRDMPFQVKNLSGGELQRVALVIALGTPADIYLIDEPSAYLDSEQRIVAARVIKRFIMHAKKTGFIVEHDFIMATYLADRVVVYEGKQSVKCTALAQQSLLTGMNLFLKSLEVTFRRDPENYRPRINKLDSVNDAEQKSTGRYFFMDE